MKILITGIHGFVGKNLVTALKQEHTVYGLDIISPKCSGIKCTYGWDELIQIPMIDVIIHLAGKAHDTQNLKEKNTFFEINTDLTKRIYDYYLSSSANKFFMMSSVKAVADTVEGILTEEIIPLPQTAYGKSKLLAENYIYKHRKVSKNYYIFRSCMIHGPGNKGNLNLLYRLVSKGIPWPLGAFDNNRSYLSIENLNFVLGQFIEKNISSGIYNVSDDVPLSTNQLIRMISKINNRKVRIWNIPIKLVTVFAKIGDVFHLSLNSERLKKLTESYIVSNNKLKSALGVKNMPITSIDGINTALKFFRNMEGNSI